MNKTHTYIHIYIYTHIPDLYFYRLSTGKLFLRKLVGRNLEALGAKIGILAIIVCVLVFIIGTLVARVNSPGWTVWRGEIWFYHWTTYRLYMCWKLVEGCGLYNKLILNLTRMWWVGSWTLQTKTLAIVRIICVLVDGQGSCKCTIVTLACKYTRCTIMRVVSEWVWHQNCHVTKCIKNKHHGSKNIYRTGGSH